MLHRGELWGPELLSALQLLVGEMIRGTNTEPRVEFQLEFKMGAHPGVSIYSHLCYLTSDLEMTFVRVGSQARSCLGRVVLSSDWLSLWAPEGRLPPDTCREAPGTACCLHSPSPSLAAPKAAPLQALSDCKREGMSRGDCFFLKP